MQPENMQAQNLLATIQKKMEAGMILIQQTNRKMLHKISKLFGDNVVNLSFLLPFN